ncbi:MAG: HAMP domain-containing histidine kinase [Candidatus Caenarcaniphilales bacterium]|jgi:signal transduction histidine kinase|nr:HAMP domain-containing histidine kinase [Candidatus Caenarcaniphilales bacterium]
MSTNLQPQPIEISWTNLRAILAELDQAKTLQDLKNKLKEIFLQKFAFEESEIYILENPQHPNEIDQISELAETVFFSKNAIEEIFLSKRPCRISKKEVIVPLEFGARIIGLLHFRNSVFFVDEQIELLWSFADLFSQTLHQLIFTDISAKANKEELEQISHSIFANVKGFLEAALERLKILEEQNQQLVKINETRTELINNVSHELRTPLVSIMGFSKILQRREITNDLLREASDQIQSAGSRLSRMIDDLIQLNRASTKGWDINVEKLDIGEMTRFIVDSLAPLNKEHHFTFSYPEDYPLIEGDRKLLRQVIENLLLNAIKYSPDGGEINCSVSLEADLLKFAVKDNGIGMTKEEQERIFDRFYRAKNTRTENIPGLGLGLSICKDVVEALGGNIFCESKFNEGSKFTIMIRSADGN